MNIFYSIAWSIQRFGNVFRCKPHLRNTSRSFDCWYAVLPAIVSQSTRTINAWYQIRIVHSQWVHAHIVEISDCDRYEFVEYRWQVERGGRLSQVSSRDHGISCLRATCRPKSTNYLDHSGEFSDEFRENIRNSRRRSIYLLLNGRGKKKEKERENYETLKLWLKSSEISNEMY